MSQFIEFEAEESGDGSGMNTSDDQHSSDLDDFINDHTISESSWTSKEVSIHRFIIIIHLIIHLFFSFQIGRKRETTDESSDDSVITKKNKRRRRRIVEFTSDDEDVTSCVSILCNSILFYLILFQ